MPFQVFDWRNYQTMILNITNFSKSQQDIQLISKYSVNIEIKKELGLAPSSEHRSSHNDYHNQHGYDDHVVNIVG
jgi:hypothetical protein